MAVVALEEAEEAFLEADTNEEVTIVAGILLVVGIVVATEVEQEAMRRTKVCRILNPQRVLVLEGIRLSKRAPCFPRCNGFSLKGKFVY